MTENDIKVLLAKRYSPPEYAFFTEVGTSTGAAMRWVDGVAYSLYASTGHEISGFEIKVSRSDFLAEMKNPGKSGDAMCLFDRWWLVAPKGIAAKEEIPKNWGFYEIVNGKFFKRKHAPELTPDPLNLSFIAAMLRRATEDVVPRSILREHYDKAREEVKGEFAHNIEQAKINLDNYKSRVREFEQASGLDVLDGWRGGREIGEAVKFVLDGGFNRLDYNFNEAAGDLLEIVEKIKKIQTLSKSKLILTNR